MYVHSKLLLPISECCKTKYLYSVKTRTFFMSLFFNWTYVVRKSMHMDLSAKSYLPSLWLGSMLQTLRKVIWLLYYLLCLPPQSSQLLFQTWSNIFPPCRKTFVTLQVSLTLNIRLLSKNKRNGILIFVHSLSFVTSALLLPWSLMYLQWW